MPVDRQSNPCLANVSTAVATWADHDKITAITESFLAGWQGLAETLV